MKCVKWFSDEGDASYESSTDSESESNSEVRGAAKTDSNDKDGTHLKGQNFPPQFPPAGLPCRGVPI